MKFKQSGKSEKDSTKKSEGSYKSMDSKTFVKSLKEKKMKNKDKVKASCGKKIMKKEKGGNLYINSENKIKFASKKSK